MMEGEKWEGKWFQIGSYKNTYNDHGNKKNQVVSLAIACYVPNLKCAPREFYFLFLKGGHLLKSQS